MAEPEPNVATLVKPTRHRAMTRGDRDAAIAALASEQHGVVTREQLSKHLKLSAGSIDWLVEGGNLTLLHRGVYATKASADTVNRKLLAAVFAAGPGAVASHRAAAHLLGLGDLEPVVEVSTVRARRARIDGVHVHRRRVLPAGHHFVRQGIPVTTEHVTVCHLAEVLEHDPLELVLDHGLHSRRITCDGVRAALAELGRLHGARTLVKLLDARIRGRAHNHSPLEQRLARQLEAAGLVFVRQFEIALGDELEFLDFAFPDEKLNVETDGYKHHSSRQAFQDDRTRDTALVKRGWRVLRFTAADVDSGRACRVVEETLALLRV